MRRLPLLALLALLSFPVGARAAEEATSDPPEGAVQDQVPEPAAPAPAPPLVVEADRILASLASHRQEGERTRALLAEAAGDDVEALRRHLEENGLAFMRELARFVDNLLARERAGLDTAESRALVDERMRPIGQRIEELVVEAEEAVAALRAQRGDVEPKEREDLEDRIATRAKWLDAVYEALGQHARALERLGLDSEDERVFLAARLSERSVLLGGRVRLGRDRVATLEEKLEEAPDETDLEDELRLARQQLTTATASLRQSIDLMNELGLDTNDARKLLIETTGELELELLDRELIASLMRDWWDRGREMAREIAPDVLARALRFLLVLALFWVLARITRVAVRRAVKSSRFQISVLLQNMLMGLAARAVLIIGVLLGLSQIGVEIAPLLAGLGIAGFIVGFALQDTLSNFASGAMILVYRPFDVGDTVDAGGVFGKVHDMSLVSTTLLTFDNQTLVVPNSKIWGNVITNLTSRGTRRVDLEVRVGYREDVEKVVTLLSELVAKHPKVLGEPVPLIKVHELAEAGVVLIVRPWANTTDYWEVYWDLQREIVKRLNAEGIEVPIREDFVQPRRGDEGENA